VGTCESQFCLHNIILDLCDYKQVPFDGVDFNPKVQQRMLMFSKFVEFFCTRQKIYETTCILHESFLSILENYLMIARPNLLMRITFFSRVMVFLP